MSKRTLFSLSNSWWSVIFLTTISLNVFGAINEPKTWQIAPPSPSISDAERQSELGKRRQEVLQRMNEKSLMVLFSAEPKVYTNDVEYPFRQEINLASRCQNNARNSFYFQTESAYRNLER
jgi:hypothetical protein